MPHRLDRAVVGSHLGRRRARARDARDGRRRGVPRPARPGADPALHPAVRSVRPGARLHQGLPARHPRERRPVHPCRDLDRDGVRGPRRRRPSQRALLDPEPDQPHEHPRRRPSLQSGALRRGRRRLRRIPPRRTRWLDLVYRLRGLDVSGRPRVAPRVPPTRHRAPSRSLHPARVAALRDRVPLSRVALRDHGREPARGHARHLDDRRRRHRPAVPRRPHPPHR